MDLLKAPPSGSGDGKESSPTNTDVAPKPVTLKTFKPGTDKPLAAAIKLEDDAWRIDALERGPTDVHFFTVRDPVPDTGVILIRAKIKSKCAPMVKESEKLQGFLFLGTYLDRFGRPDAPPTFRGEMSDWTTLEARCPAYNVHQTDPPVISVDLSVWYSGTVWIKDIELVHIPPAQTPEPPLRKKDEVVVKSFTYKDKPITTDFVNETMDGWRFWAYDPRSFRLFELIDPDLEGCRLIFRARLRSSESSGAFLQIRARFPNEPNEVVTPKPPVIVEGNTNWATYEVEMVLPPKRRPELLRLNLESLGVKGGDKNRVWIKDMELLKAP